MLIISDSGGGAGGGTNDQENLEWSGAELINAIHVITISGTN